MIAPRTVRCPQCGALVEWTPDAPWRPFCSERCKTIDLGAWATGAYRIAADQDADDEASGTPDDGAPADST